MGEIKCVQTALLYSLFKGTVIFRFIKWFLCEFCPFASVLNKLYQQHDLVTRLTLPLEYCSKVCPLMSFELVMTHAYVF